MLGLWETKQDLSTMLTSWKEKQIWYLLICLVLVNSTLACMLLEILKKESNYFLIMTLRVKLLRLIAMLMSF